MEATWRLPAIWIGAATNRPDGHLECRCEGQEQVPETVPARKLNAFCPLLSRTNAGAGLADVETSWAPAFVANGLGNPESGNIHSAEGVRVVELIVTLTPTTATACFHMLRW